MSTKNPLTMAELTDIANDAYAIPPSGEPGSFISNIAP